MRNMKKGMKSGLVLAAAVLTIGSMTITSLAAGWEKQKEGEWKYQNEDGSYLANGFAPDGYYIDGSGLWASETDILTAKVPNRNHFLRASEAGSLTSWQPQIVKAMDILTKECGDVRGFALEDSKITYYTIDGETETELMSFYKDSVNDGYCLRLKCALSSDKGTVARTSWYDYQVMRLLVSMVSRTGNEVADAIYSSWESNNTHGLKFGQWVPAGDTQILYDAVSGAGIYHIR